jgi:hypothetical protein
MFSARRMSPVAAATFRAQSLDCGKEMSVLYIAMYGQTVRAEGRRSFAGRVYRDVWINSQR